MPIPRTLRAGLQGLGLSALAAAAWADGPAAPPATPPAAPVMSGPAPAAIKATTTDDWTVLRVGGDLEAKAVWDDKKGWLFDKSRIETPLPVGYPAPTPPGAIELKKYPSVRRAEITGNGDAMAGSSGFWPLFRHISRNKIDMTAPVEMDYPGMEKGEPTSSTMSFLYRTPELRATGVDERDPRVKIRDTEPVTVLALGARGDVDPDANARHFKVLEEWLANNPQWRVAGPYRTLGYNGPDTRRSRRWVEAQIPVAPATTATTTPAAPPATAPAAPTPPAAEPGPR